MESDSTVAQGGMGNHKVQSLKLKVRSSKLKAQSSKLKVQSSK